MLRRIAGKFAGIFKQPPAMPSQLQGVGWGEATHRPTPPRIDQPSKMVELGGKMYRLSKAERVYKELTNPRSPGVFYQDNRAIGTIDKNGKVRFYTQWDDLANRDDTPGGWSLKTPAELGETQVSSSPVGRVVDVLDALNTKLRYSDRATIKSNGAGLYYNLPVSDKRAALYQIRARFSNANFPPDWERYQVNDNRRFAGNPTIAELYILGDAGHLKNPVAAEVLREQLLERHPHLREIVEQKLAAGTPFGPADIPSEETMFVGPGALSEDTAINYSLMARKRKVVQDILSLLGK